MKFQELQELCILLVNEGMEDVDSQDVLAEAHQHLQAGRSRGGSRSEKQEKEKEKMKEKGDKLGTWL